jgi:hypothetical protein
MNQCREGKNGNVDEKNQRGPGESIFPSTQDSQLPSQESKLWSLQASSRSQLISMSNSDLWSSSQKPPGQTLNQQAVTSSLSSSTWRTGEKELEVNAKTERRYDYDLFIPPSSPFVIVIIRSSSPFIATSYLHPIRFLLYVL